MSTDLRKYRNIGIAAHIDAGKTTLTERILLYTGVSHKLGEVHEGEAVMDWMAQERERGITITSAATTCYWRDYHVNIIDTPGHVDFTIEVGRSLRVLDGMIGVFCGVAGVQPQSETVWRQASRYHVPRIVFINKMDRVGADYRKAVQSINDKLKGNALIMQVQVGYSENFCDIIDLLTMKMAHFADGLNVEFEWRDIPQEFLKEAQKLRQHIVERACDFDEALAEKYLNEQEITIDEIKKAIRKGVTELKVAPAFCGTAFKNKGIQLLLDAVIDYLPSPIDVPPIEGVIPGTETVVKCEARDDASFYALAFKIMIDPFVGTLTFVRVYSGVLKSGSYVYNPRTERKERVSRLLRMHANRRTDVDEFGAGDIGAVVGLKDVNTGDTLCTEAKPLLLESIEIPASVISASVEPKTKADYEKMSIALKKMAQEDPSFRVSYNPETGQTVIAGMGELHLEIIVDRLKREHKVDVAQGKLQVAYKETIRKTVESEGKYIKQSGGRGQYGHVRIRFEPLERGSGFEFENAIVGGSIPREYIPAVEKGLIEAVNNGILAGYPVVDVKASLYDGSYHEVDSSEMAFKIAAIMAFKDAMKHGAAVLLEPIMKVEVDTPEEHMGDVIGDLNSRRGRISDMVTNAGATHVVAEVPLETMLGYATDLRSMTKGRASYTMEPDCYREVPQSVQEAIVSSK